MQPFRSVARMPGREPLVHPLPAGMRDWLPEEARRLSGLGRRLTSAFELHGYEPVTLPAVEYTDVLERGLGTLEPGQVLRFVEPDTGEVLALRPDMTPQIARVVATRLADEPPPARLCYLGSVVRRRRERARVSRQIPQAGCELVGIGGADADIEVITVAAAAAAAAGLDEFVLDLGHARVAGSLLEIADAEVRGDLLRALAVKDGSALARRASSAGLASGLCEALRALAGLHGGEDVWEEADAALRGTPAEVPARELRALWGAARASRIATDVVVDLGETRNFEYYTGSMFQILAEGPGEAVGSGGRYDGLLERFGEGRPAAGFALDLDNLDWALRHRGGVLDAAVRVLLRASEAGPSSIGLLADALRTEQVPCAVLHQGDPFAHARAWRYTHVVEVENTGVTLSKVGSGDESKLRMAGADPRDLARSIARRLAAGDATHG